MPFSKRVVEIHLAQLASDRTCCRSVNANQMRLILHTAAYWLMWGIRQAMPEGAKLTKAEVGTIRLRLLKVGARVIETASRVRIAFASACPDAELFRQIALRLRAALA